MNKNVAAYLTNYLVDSGLPLALVKRLLAVSVDPTLILDVELYLGEEDQDINYTK